jgi:hypothetical protein
MPEPVEAAQAPAATTTETAQAAMEAVVTPSAATDAKPTAWKPRWRR